MTGCRFDDIAATVFNTRAEIGRPPRQFAIQMKVDCCGYFGESLTKHRAIVAIREHPVHFKVAPQDGDLLNEAVFAGTIEKGVGYFENFIDVRQVESGWAASKCGHDRPP